MRSKLSRLLLIVATLILAAPPAAYAANSNAADEQNCVAQAQPLGSTTQPTVQCYATFSAAISAATHNRVHLKNATRSRRVSSAELAGDPGAPLTTYVLSIDYHDANFRGNTLTWQQTSTCGYFQAGSMPSGWNDVVSSVAAYSGCATTLFWNANFGQPVYQIHVDGSAATLGSFNDNTSSQKWCPIFPCG